MSLYSSVPTTSSYKSWLRLRPLTNPGINPTVRDENVCFPIMMKCLKKYFASKLNCLKQSFIWYHFHSTRMTTEEFHYSIHYLLKVCFGGMCIRDTVMARIWQDCVVQYFIVYIIDKFWMPIRLWYVFRLLYTFEDRRKNSLNFVAISWASVIVVLSICSCSANVFVEVCELFEIVRICCHINLVALILITFDVKWFDLARLISVLVLFLYFRNSAKFFWFLCISRYYALVQFLRKTIPAYVLMSSISFWLVRVGQTA